MLELLRPTYDFGPVYAEKLVADVPEEQMCAQPVPGRIMNHAAWSLGHLAWSNDHGMAMIGGTKVLEHLKTTVGMGSVPVADRSAYPSKQELLRMLRESHVRMIAALTEVKPEVLAAAAPERIRHMFPTVGTMVAGLITAHQGNHLGQLSAWRRAMGFKSVF